MGELDSEKTADYILQWLERRNGGELQEAFDTMRRIDHQNMRAELVLIIQCGGKPPNWVA